LSAVAILTRPNAYHSSVQEKNKRPDSRRDSEEAAYHRHSKKGADGRSVGRGFDYTCIRKLVGKVRNETVVEIDRAQIEARLAFTRENYRMCAWNRSESYAGRPKIKMASASPWRVIAHLPVIISQWTALNLKIP
jgi:hypothetical protein